MGIETNNLHPIILTLIATTFTWFMTALGAATVIFAKELSRKLLDGMLGFASGLMIAATYWSLLAPAIELSKEMNITPWFPPAVGFLAGGIFLWVLHRALPHIHLEQAGQQRDGSPSSLRRATLFFIAIVLHNIPEGLAIGVAYGFAGLEGNSAMLSLSSAVALTLGIGFQNLPEGIAAAFPLRREGFSRRRCFWYGQLSGIVEPIAGLAGVILVLFMRPILPYAQGFAAGAMIFVVMQELIPASQTGGHSEIATMSGIVGFVFMMILDSAFGV